MDMCVKSSMSDGLVEILPSASGEMLYLWEKHTALNETAPSPDITSKQPFLL
jgi:hypothetical protein